MAIYGIDGIQLDSVYEISGNSISQAYDIEGNPLLETQTNIVVMSYNVQWFTDLNSNATMQESIIDTYKPDIIGFQEFQRDYLSNIPALATQLLSSDYPYINMGNYGNKNAIVAKYQMSNFTTVPHTTQTMNGQSYSTASVTIGGKQIFLVVSHLTTSTYEATKVEQAEEIFEALQGHDYFILTGDFNTTCKSVNDTEYTTIMKQFVDAGYNVANCTEQHGFIDTWTGDKTAGGTWYPCDHIITSANIAINTVIADTLKIETSAGQQIIDHLPLIAYCTIN